MKPGFDISKLRFFGGIAAGAYIPTVYAEDVIEIHYDGIGSKKIPANTVMNTLYEILQKQGYLHHMRSVNPFDIKEDKFWKEFFERLHKEDQYVEFEEIKL